MELRHPSSIEATLNSPKTFQQLGSLFCARLRDNSRLLDHLQPWLSYGASTSSTLATLVSWSHGKVLFIQHCSWRNLSHEQLLFLQVAAWLCFFLGAHLLRGVEEGHLQVGQ